MENKEKVQELLDKAKELLDKREQHLRKARENGTEFNIFTVLDRERKEESTHCRLIYELLNPEGSHGRGDAFLRLFFDTIKKPFPEHKKIIVERERHTDYGRPDLLIWGDGFCYPIEVKIDAGDQDRQVKRYLQFAEEKGRGQEKFDATVYYLTLDGREPSEKSVGNAPSEQIENIAFSRQIKEWLKQCVEITTDFPNIRVILEHYKELIVRLEKEVPMSELTTMIKTSKNFYESAAEIEKALLKVRAEKMKSVFSEIEEFIRKQFGDQFEKIKEYSTYPEEAETYYSSVKRPDPSLAYRIWGKGELSVELWFQVDHYNGGFLWYGVVLHKGKNKIPKAEEIKSFLNVFGDPSWNDKINEFVNGNKKYVWWVWSKELPVDDPQTFNADDSGYSKLFGSGKDGDSDEYGKMMEKIKSELETQLDNIKGTGLRGIPGAYQKLDR